MKISRAMRYALPALAVLVAVTVLLRAPETPAEPTIVDDGPVSQEPSETAAEPAIADGGSGYPASSESFFYARQDGNGTTIYRATPRGDGSVAFADRGTPIAIHTLELATRLVATPSGRLFAYAKPRSLSEEDFFPRGQTVFRTEAHRTYVFELSTDGSNGVRRVAEVLGTQSPRRFLVSPSGGRVAYFNVEWEEDEQGISHELHWIYVHDTESGDLAFKVDAGLRGYDEFRGATWLDESRIYLWRLPVEEEHMAADQDLGKSVGPHVIDVTTGIATSLESDGLLAMLDEEERGREGAAPDCGVALDTDQLLCQAYTSAYRRDPACYSVLRERRVFSFDLDGMRPTLQFSTGPTCADRWSLSPSFEHAVGLETLRAGTGVSGQRLYVLPSSSPGAEPVTIAVTESSESRLYPIGWVRG